MLFPSWLRGLRLRLESPRPFRTRQRPVRRPLLDTLEDRTLPSAYVVSTTADSGPGSLRDAINQIDLDTSHTLYASPSNPSVDEIDFAITAASDTGGGFNSGTGVATITPPTDLPSITNAVLMDGYTQSGASPNTTALGDNAVLKVQLDLNASAALDWGFRVDASSTTIRGLVVNDPSATSTSGTYGFYITGTGDLLSGNFIGTDPTGTQVVGNLYGIYTSGASALVIGGTTPAARNIVSGNTDGISDAYSTTTQIEGNYVGTDVTGTRALGNTKHGIISGGTIGGTAPGAGNLVSGNNIGIEGGVIQGNLIGTDATGTKAVGNFIGIGGADLIGGTTPAARNIISGNTRGIDRVNAPIEGNYIGTDITGTMSVGNVDGIRVPSGAVVGGTTAGTGNVILGNGNGIRGFGSNTLVEGNLIGTDYTGTQALGNGTGIDFQDGGNDNVIGGTVAGARNVISGNGNGIYFQYLYGQTSGNVVEGNYLGTDVTGTTAIAGGRGGVGLGVGATNNTIGGTTAAARNIILGGVSIGTFGNAGSLPSNNLVEGNYIGTDVTGEYALANAGLEIDGGNNNVITGNVIDAVGNRAGVGLEGFNNPSLSISGTVVQGNLIGTDASGTHTTDPNGHSFGGTYGVEVNGGYGTGVTGNWIGGTAPGQGNVIAGSSSDGVFVFGATGTAILGNSIHDNGGLGIDLASGANNNQAAPSLTAVYTDAGGTLLTGTLTSTPSATFHLEFFANTTGDPEGRTFLGIATVTTDASGHGSFHIVLLSTVPAGQGLVTATATGPDNSTSAFSAGVQAVFLTPSSLSGFVFADFNDDGQIDFGEKGIAGVTITLTGTDLFGNAVSLSQQTDGSGAYLFLNLRTGTYTITETQPASYLQGIDTVGTAGGSLVGTDQFSVPLASGVDGLNYNYGEQPAAGGPVRADQTAGIGFWNNKHGQALIKALNGGATSTQLANWLAATLPHMFGIDAGSANLTGKTNADVAALFQADFLLKGVKLDAQVLATALSVYATNATLDPTRAAAQYDFTVSGNGVGTATVNVGCNGDAFGVANNTRLTVLDLLKATDAQAVNGVLYSGNATLRKHANDVYSDLNEEGDDD